MRHMGIPLSRLILAKSIKLSRASASPYQHIAVGGQFFARKIRGTNSWIRNFWRNYPQWPKTRSKYIFRIIGTLEHLNGCTILPRVVGMICAFFWEISLLLIWVPFSAIWELAARDSFLQRQYSPTTCMALPVDWCRLKDSTDLYGLS